MKSEQIAFGFSFNEKEFGENKNVKETQIHFKIGFHIFES